MRQTYSVPIPKLILAFAAIYFIWGSTYLAIRYAIQTLPGFMMAAVRFMLAGAILCAWAWWKKARLTGPHPWRTAFTMGFFLLLMGNGTVVLAIHWVPSGLAALLLSTTPLWVALLEWALPGGKRPSGRVSTGILLGFLGIVMLIGVGDLRSREVDLLGAGILLLSSVSWAAGTIYSRRNQVSDSPLMTSGMQMLTGGALLFGAAILNGDLSLFRLDSIYLSSVLAFGYLTFFGSIVAFTAYSWLIKVTSPARAVTSSYVNPVVALLLGRAIAGEPLTYRIIMAMATIILGVIVITTSQPAKVPARVQETAGEAV
jgi:drug/metabolite transporter (DMT)-like permease